MDDKDVTDQYGKQSIIDILHMRAFSIGPILLLNELVLEVGTSLNIILIICLKFYYTIDYSQTM